MTVTYKSFNWININEIEPVINGEYFIKTNKERIFIADYDDDLGIFTYSDGIEIGWITKDDKEIVTHYQKCVYRNPLEWEEISKFDKSLGTGQELIIKRFQPRSSDGY